MSRSLRAAIEPPHSGAHGPSPRRGLWLGLGVLLVTVIVAVGMPGLGSPWIQGDEHIFIVRNPDVTGAGRGDPLWLRCLKVFGHTHEDLYQPITIVSYAIEWSLYGPRRVALMRLTDVLLQACCALLVWIVLARLLEKLAALQPVYALGIGWSAALLWAVHPAFVTTFAADMGRTHLLATVLLLLSVLAQLKAIEQDSMRWSLVTVVCVVAAWLNKAHVAWVAVVFVLDALLAGWTHAWRRGRLWALAAVAVVLAVVTYRTTERTLLIESDPMPVFGDPSARAALAWYLHIQHLITPDGQIAVWYPPDIRTHWQNPRVWIGLLLFVATITAAAVALRNRRWRAAGLGLVWAVTIWLPVSGLIAFRVHAVSDRYFYLPAVGLLLALASVVAALIRQAPNPRAMLVAIGALSTLLAAAAVPFDMRLVREYRSTLSRAARLVQLNPQDPRVVEVLAAAYDFGRDHPTPEGWPTPTWLNGMQQAIDEAVRLAEAHPEYFPTPHAKAAFYRRLSYALWRIARYTQSLRLAEKAREIEPDSPLTWLRIAHAQRSLGRWPEARQAYQRLESLLPEDEPQLGLRLVEFGDLLLKHFGDVTAARQRFERALEREDLTPEARRVALVGLARCALLSGRLERAEVLAREALDLEPDNTEAARVIGICLLASQRWREAYALYGKLCEALPTDYEALRGFTVACTRLGRFADMTAAWRFAAAQRTDDPLYAGFAAWASACGHSPDAGKIAKAVLERWPQNRAALLARLLLSVRAQDATAALDWLDQARAAPAIPAGRLFERTAHVLDAWHEAGSLDSAGELVRAALWMAAGRPDLARPLLDAVRSDALSPKLLERVHALLAPATAPATQP